MSYGSSNLEIILANPQPAYQPGNTITGHVKRKGEITPGTENDGVTIQLIGISKTKHTLWSDHTGESQMEYTSDFTLFSPEDTCLTLPGAEAEITDGSDKRTWQFSLVIPKHASVAAVQKGASTSSYLSLDENNIVRHALPPTFSVDRGDAGVYEFLTAWVGYHLQAEFTKWRPRHQGAAKLGLVIYGFPRVDHDSVDLRIMSHRSQLRDSLFFEVECPSVYLIGVDSPLPFKFRLVTESENRRTWLGIQKSSTITLKSITISLETTTGIRYETKSSASSASATRRRDLATFTPPPNLGEAQEFTFPAGTTADFLDLTNFLDVRLQLERGGFHTVGVSGGAKTITVQPSFTTYNIKCTHQLVWNAVVLKNGKEISGEGRGDIELIGTKQS